MSEVGIPDAQLPPQDSGNPASALLARLREGGAQQVDPVGLRYLETLAARASEQDATVRQQLHQRLEQAIGEFEERLQHARRDASKMVSLGTQRYPASAALLQQLLDRGDFQALRRQMARLAAEESLAPLKSLVRQLDQDGRTSPATDASTAHPSPQTELRVIREARDTWLQLSVHKQVTQALEQAPKNAGPINSHMLMLRSLALMRELSPDYLNRFISYADTLLCLADSEKEKADKAKKTRASKAAKK